jgi:hypothetical protein
LSFKVRGVAQLVARTAGGREVAGSSPVTPTTSEFITTKRQKRANKQRVFRLASIILPLKSSSTKVA